MVSDLGLRAGYKNLGLGGTRLEVMGYWRPMVYCYL